LSNNPILLVHGGAWAIPGNMVEAHLNGVRNAIAAGCRVLEKGGTALDAVEEAVVVMEDDETFDAGRGSFLNREGKVQLDALMMDGATLRAGGVGCVEHIANPIRAARKVLSESPHVYFVGEGAERFAQEQGLPLCENKELVIPREVERLRAFQSNASKDNQDTFAPTISHDTVGRLGDSSLIGCGCYADNQSAAASTTGWGEPIMKLVLAKWATDRVASGNLPQWAAAEAMNYLKDRVNGHGGIILLDSQGRTGIAHNTPRMAWALRTSDRLDCGLESK